MQKKITIVTTELGNTGIARVLSILMKEWENQDIKITLVLIRKIDQVDFEIPQDVELITLENLSENKILRRIQSFIQLKKILKKQKDDVVLALHNTSAFIVALCRPFIKNKIVFAERNDPARSPKNPVFRLIRNILYKACDVLILQTEEQGAYFSSDLRKKASIIPNPINPDLIENSWHKGSKRIVTASRLTEQKNLPMLINAFDRFSKIFPDYKLEIYGRGEMEESLLKQIKEKGLVNRVRLAGFSSHLFEEIKSSDMYILPSNYEGISNSLLEAMGLGLPCIATDCPIGGSRFLIENGKNGILIPVGDEKALYNSMVELATNSELAENLSAHAYQVREKYKASKVAQIWIDKIWK